MARSSLRDGSQNCPGYSRCQSALTALTPHSSFSVAASVMIRSVYKTYQALPKSVLQTIGSLVCNQALYIVRPVTVALLIIVGCGLLSVSFHSVAFADTCDEFGVLTTTTPAPPHDEWAWRAYADELAAVGAGPIDLMLVGDSLAQAWDTQMWAPKKVLNFGIGGDRTQHVLWRLQSSRLFRVKPTAVLVTVGTNNLEARDRPCAIIDGITKVIKRVQRLWPASTVGVLDIPPRGNGFLFRNDARLEVNGALKKIPGIRTIDADAAISCSGQQPCSNYVNDNLHFTTAGYRVLLKLAMTSLFGK